MRERALGLNCGTDRLPRVVFVEREEANMAKLALILISFYNIECIITPTIKSNAAGE